MKSLAAVVCFFYTGFSLLCRADTLPAFAKNYQDGLLTNDYGIITEEDLAVEAWNAVTSPFDPNTSIDGYHRWQCFPVKDVKPKTHSWHDFDPAEYPNGVTMCDLEIWVEHDEQVQVYGGRRAYEVSFCRNYMKAWKKLTRGEKMVCLSGLYGGIYQPASKHDPKVPYKSWTWDKIKSKKGCYAYFVGENCQVYIEKWKKAGSPRPQPKK